MDRCLLDGIARVGSSAFGELRNAVFATVAQRAIRVMANNIFMHLHNMDLSFHLSRQTGALARALDRGNKGVRFFLTSIVFNIFPTIFEVGLVAGILGHKYGHVYTTVHHNLRVDKLLVLSKGLVFRFLHSSVFFPM